MAGLLWTPEMDAHLAAMRAERVSAEKIASALGVTKSAVCGRANRLKLPLIGAGIGRPRGQNKKSIARDIKEYLAANPKSTARDISAALGLQYNTVRSAIGRLKLKAGRERTYDGRERILKYQAANPEKNSVQIAAAVGVSRNYVGIVCHEFGITLPKIPPKGWAAKRRRSNVIQLPNRVALRTSDVNAGAGKTPPPAPAAKPKLRVIVNEQQLIAEFIAKNGVRKIPERDTCDFYGVQAWLRERGHKLSSGGSFYVLDGRKFHKSFGWRKVLKIVDRMRVKEGLPPIVRAA